MHHTEHCILLEVLHCYCYQHIPGRVAHACETDRALISATIIHPIKLSNIMHLSKNCSTYPHPGKGGDLEAAKINAPDDGAASFQSIHCYYDW